jgi:thioredoxin-related protein
MKTLFVFTLAVLLGTSTEWLTNFDQAKMAAAKEDKCILLNFSGSDWCGPCIKMKKEVFESEAFQSLANDKLVLVRADFPRQKRNQLSKEQIRHNEALAEKYNPDGKFPLTLLLDQDGKLLKKWDGYNFAGQDKFIADLKTTLASQ